MWYKPSLQTSSLQTISYMYNTHTHSWTSTKPPKEETCAAPHWRNLRDSTLVPSCMQPYWWWLMLWDGKQIMCMFVGVNKYKWCTVCLISCYHLQLMYNNLIIENGSYHHYLLVLATQTIFLTYSRPKYCSCRLQMYGVMVASNSECCQWPKIWLKHHQHQPIKGI